MQRHDDRAPEAGRLGDMGGDVLLLPDALNRALEAKYRLEYCFDLLAQAERHALEPEALLPDLRPEREANGIEDADLDRVVSGTSREDGVYLIPHAERVHRLVVDCIDDMIAPLVAAWPSGELTPAPRLASAGARGGRSRARALGLRDHLLEEVALRVRSGVKREAAFHPAG
jgi:hypothetical protein